MKVLLLIKNFDFGGAENHVCDLANGLYEAGCSVYIGSKGGRQVARLLPGIIHIPIKFSDFRMIHQFRKIVGIIHREKIDVIHAHQHLPILSGTLASEISRIPLIATVHGRLRHDVPYLFEKKCLRRIIAISENSLNGIKNHQVLDEKAIYIPNGISIHVKPFERQSEKLSFYYISRIDKRHSNLIWQILCEVWPAIVSSHPNATFTIVGDGKGLPKLEKMMLSGNYKYSSTVRISGFVADVTSSTSDASLVLGVGRVALKCLAQATPVFSIKHNRFGGIITTENLARFSYGNFVDINGPMPNTANILQTFNHFRI